MGLKSDKIESLTQNKRQRNVRKFEGFQHPINISPTRKKTVETASFEVEQTALPTGKESRQYKRLSNLC